MADNQQDTKNPSSEYLTSASNFWELTKRIFNLNDQIDKAQTRAQILENINFQGIAAYVLIISIFIASIGLNANSVAVVIGAMLISPLMGPIMGLGYAIAVNDIETLNRSILNFGVMVVIAILTSFIYFSLAPLTILTEQLAGRIEPTFLDVLIGILGGFAGVAAFSSRIKNSNVIAGVAIATALMPPLCTVGFGLSMGDELIGYKGYTGFSAALNAFYLFTINSIFIGISTFVFIKINRFPLAKYQNAKQQRKTNIIIAIVGFLTIIPSTFIFYGIVKEELYKSKIQTFLNNVVAPGYDNSFINLKEPILTSKDSINYITISTISEKIPNDVIKNWNTILENKYDLKNSRLLVHQGANASELQVNEKLYSSMYSAVQGEINKKDSIINEQRLQISRLNSDSIPFQSLSKELKALYPSLSYFGYAPFSSTNFKKKTVIPSFILQWENDSINQAEEAKLKSFLKSRLSLDTLQLLRP